MDTLLLAGVCIGGFLIAKKDKKENFTESHENGSRTYTTGYKLDDKQDIKKTIEEVPTFRDEYRIDQYPIKNRQAMENSMRNVPAFPQGVNYSTGPLKTPLETKLNKESKIDLLDMSKRPMSDFLNNNFIPNRKADTQNMNGTGIKNGNFLPEQYNMGGDPGQLMSRTDTGFGPGADPTYMHKRASGPRFSPNESAQWVHGKPDIRPDLDRFKMDIRNKQYESPCEKVFYVGPGVGLDPSISASGGFNAGLNNRIIPNNIFNYNSNQLPGKVVQGKLYSAELPTANPGSGTNMKGEIYGVPNNKKPKTFWSYDDRPPVESGQSALLGNHVSPKITLPNNNRAITSGFGPLITDN